MAASTNIAGEPLKDLCEGLDPSPTNVRSTEPKKELDRSVFS